MLLKYSVVLSVEVAEVGEVAVCFWLRPQMEVAPIVEWKPRSSMKDLLD